MRYKIIVCPAYVTVVFFHDPTDSPFRYIKLWTWRNVIQPNKKQKHPIGIISEDEGPFVVNYSKLELPYPQGRISFSSWMLKDFYITYGTYQLDMLKSWIIWWLRNIDCLLRQYFVLFFLRSSGKRAKNFLWHQSPGRRRKGMSLTQSHG